MFIGNGNETAPKYKVKVGKFNLAINLTNTKKGYFLNETGVFERTKKSSFYLRLETD